MYAVVAATVLAGCGDADPASEPGAGPPATVSPAAQTQLTVEVKKSAKAAPRTWSLTCDPPAGSHPRAAAACAALAQRPGLLKPPPKDQACTQIYGGPQVATISGIWQSKPVTVKFTRMNGCELTRWNQAEVLLGKA
jgi:subtilisin inhibitor-like